MDAATIPGDIEDVEIVAGRTGQGPDPVIALHGITSHHHAFNAIARHLAHPDGMLALDLRGRGDSGKPPSGYGLDVHARDVVRVLDHVGIARAVLMGHSMGAFAAAQTALMYPHRVRALALLDGGWPRVEAGPNEEATVDEEAKRIEDGLRRAFSRLVMAFKTPDDYVDFWFPGQGLTMDTLPPDLADNYRYDLRQVEGGWRPKCLLEAALEDARWNAAEAATAARLSSITVPTALIRASEGFFPGTPPLIGDEAHAAMAQALPLRADTMIPGSNHYTIMYEPAAIEVARIIDDVVGSY